MDRIMPRVQRGGLPLALTAGTRLRYFRIAGTLAAVHDRVCDVPFQIAAYRDILTALGYGGYRASTSNVGGLNLVNLYENCCQFAYNWRCDNVEAAARLHVFILGKKAFVEQ